MPLRRDESWEVRPMAEGPSRTRRSDAPAFPAGTASRRSLLRGAGLVAAVGALGIGGYGGLRALRPPSLAEVDLFSQTVAFDGGRGRVLVDDATSRPGLHPGTRLLTTAANGSEDARRADDFLAAAAPWRQGVPEELGSLADSALLDLWVLSDGLPAPVAGWSSNWRYVWPRDTAFCAAALARIGHVEAALSALEYLQQLQRADGWFEARYHTTDHAAPDDRNRQFDGTGLAVWSVAEVLAQLPEEDREDARTRLDALITTSYGALLEHTSDGQGMPPVSPDYWEVSEYSVTLGIMACTLAGLGAGGALTGDDSAAANFTDRLTGSFGRSGYQRYQRHGGADSARAFLDATGRHGIIGPDRLHALQEESGRPAGGIAPGASWKNDGVSWTPSTTLLALALARAGDREGARELLGWVADHRTGAGSIPEKVLHDGRPAAVAPLSWSAANVLLTIDALQG